MKYTDEQIFDALTAFLAKDGGAEKVAGISPETDIVGQGLVDSVGIFKLITFVEEKFGITIEPDEVLLENFKTLQALKNLVVKKLGSVPPAASAAKA